MAITKKIIDSITSQSGVYFFLNKEIYNYIGKALNLKARIKSHLQNAKVDPIEKLIINNSNQIRTIITNSNFKSLLLEAKFIRKYQPKYNVQWKDNKNFLYIKITINDKYPKILLTRKEKNNKSIYFGPFNSTNIINQLLRDIRKIVPFCTQNKINRYPCFYSKIGLCNPCPYYIEKYHDKKLFKLYLLNIKKIINILEGNSDLVLNSLDNDLKIEIKEEKYENALILRNKIYLLNRLTSERSFTDQDLIKSTIRSYINEDKYIKLLFSRVECYDVSNLLGKEATGAMVVFTNGLPDKNNYRRFKIKLLRSTSDTNMLYEILNRRFLRKEWPFPSLILIDGGKPQINIVQKILNKHNLKIPLLGIAKHPDRIIYPDHIKSTQIKKNYSIINLLRYMRDESHRFARNYHLILRKKKMML